ncbi:NAD-dependent epimerase/dehydratase family protein [Novosphingobium sp. B 225]|uniref:NAD-dependent epimerase/dehydratase family protein n=1 Tax=Novosphingobium sp. B 225 TaxID=1961849 RepID=UPI000B4A97E1|nr:NAD(P)-dependent oxidoreductase [Novosphingobium sp. B 225]
MPETTFSPKPIVITGPTGWIGRALLAQLHRKGDRDALAPGQEVRLFGSSDGSIAIGDGVTLPIRNLATISAEDVADAHVIHLAYLTKDKVAVVGEEEFHRINRGIDDAVLDAISGCAPASLFVASSGAASLAEAGLDKHPYGLAKLEQEARFLAWAEKFGVPALCGRIFNIAGPHINKLEAYAVSAFALQALGQGHIAIKATQPVFRSFLHVEDLSRIILRAARHGLGEPGPIDLCGAQVVEMSGIAQVVSEEVGGSITVERPPIDYSSRSDYLGIAQETCIICMKLAVSPTGMRQQIRDTVEWIRELEGASVTRN